MARRIESHIVPGPAGDLEALLEEPEHSAPRMAAIVCHPYPLFGGTMHNKVVYRLARFLLAAGFPTSQGPADYLERCPVTKIFLQSTHDEFGPRPELEALYARFAEPKRLVWIEAADHFFAGALEKLEEEVRRSAGFSPRNMPS